MRKGGREGELDEMDIFAADLEIILTKALLALFGESQRVVIHSIHSMRALA